jgi:serine protease Do
MEKVRIRAVSWVLFVFALGVFVTIVVLKYSGKFPQLNLQNNIGDVIQKRVVVEEESATIDVVKKVSPSVVSIAVENRSVLDPVLGISRPIEKQSGIGTGFIVSSDGLILTNKHVVSSSDEKYVVVMADSTGKTKNYEVKKITRDPSSLNDMALIKIDASGLKPVELGDSDKLKVGQKVIAIGNALGRFENSVTAGIVSGLGRGVTPVDPSTGISENLEGLVQTDAAINPGNSGGPLVDISGHVIGINTAVADAQNIGFAIKINVAKALLDEYNKSGGKIVRPQLGVRYRYISKDTALLNDVPEGEFVQEVVVDSAADKAGLFAGDIITTLDGVKMTDENALTNFVKDKKVGEKISVRVFRDGQTLDLTATLGEVSTQ